jgi:hypothetical protein
MNSLKLKRILIPDLLSKICSGQCLIGTMVTAGTEIIECLTLILSCFSLKIGNSVDTGTGLEDRDFSSNLRRLMKTISKYILKIFPIEQLARLRS